MKKRFALSEDYLILFVRGRLSLKTAYGVVSDWEAPSTPAIGSDGFFYSSTSAAGGGNAKAMIFKRPLDKDEVAH